MLRSRCMRTRVLVIVLGVAACSREVEHEGRPISYWIDQMTSADSMVRHRAVEAFAHDASKSPEAARALMAVLASERDADVHATVAEALGSLGPNALEATPALVRLLEDNHIVLRERAASTLGEIGTRSPLVVPALVSALMDPHHDVRAAAAEALGRIGSGAATGAIPLARLVQTDGIGWVRVQAAQALGKIGSERDTVIPILVRATRSERSELRMAALEALGHFLAPGASADSAITLALRDSNPDVRDAAVRARNAVRRGTP
ncbi:MAG: HEAT repeat domain-containing protein [Gemmatimonadota bacterium]